MEQKHSKQGHGISIKKLPSFSHLSFHLSILTSSIHCLSGPGCSKLTTWLVHVSFKFQTLISQIRQYFLLKIFYDFITKYTDIFCWKNERSLSHFFNKNISVFGYKVVKYLTSWPLNELVKLTMLWTTGFFFFFFFHLGLPFTFLGHYKPEFPTVNYIVKAGTYTIWRTTMVYFSLTFFLFFFFFFFLIERFFFFFFFFSLSYSHHTIKLLMTRLSCGLQRRYRKTFNVWTRCRLP